MNMLGFRYWSIVTWQILREKSEDILLQLREKLRTFQIMKQTLLLSPSEVKDRCIYPPEFLDISLWGLYIVLCQAP